jgi:hypothetical protein
MEKKKNSILHWILGIPAFLYILLFTYIPISEFFIVLFASDNADRPIGESEIWFYGSRTVFLIFNLIYGIINIVFTYFAGKYLIKKESASLLITFAIFFSLFFFLFLITGDWLQN